MKSNVNLYLNADGTKVVTEGPEAASLLLNAGREVPDAEIEAYGEGLLKQAQALGGEKAAKAEAPSEDKAMEPAEDKAVAQSENKGGVKK